MKRVAAIILAAALAACTASAPKAELKEDSSALANIQVVTSPGGITAWLVEEKSVPIVAMQMSWLGGSAGEPQGKDGVGWVLGYMMNEGAGGLDSQAYGARMEDLNMSFGCQIGDDWSACTLNTLAATRKDAFEMARLAFAEPRFDDEPLERAKRELAVNLAQAETSPGVIAGRAMNAAMIPGHPYARYATPDTVKTITKADVVNLKRQIMTKDQLLVTVVGDISAAELAPELDRMFAGLAANTGASIIQDANPKPAPAEPVVVKLGIPQTLVMFSGPGLTREDPDFYAAFVLNYILGGGGFSSRLMDDIREKRGLTYGIGTGLSVDEHMARWTGSASTRNDSAREVVRLVKEHIGRLGAEGPTQKELDDAKAYLTGAYPLGFDSNGKIAGALMGVRQDKLGLDYVAKRNSIINAVTMDDVKRVAAKYMRPEAFTFVLVGQPA